MSDPRYKGGLFKNNPAITFHMNNASARTHMDRLTNHGWHDTGEETEIGRAIFALGTLARIWRAEYPDWEGELYINGQWRPFDVSGELSFCEITQRVQAILDDIIPWNGEPLYPTNALHESDEYGL